MGAELSTYEGNATEQASTNSRNSTRSTSRTETHRKSREVLRLVRSLEVRADFYELKEKHNGAGQKRDVDERKEVKNEGPSCYTVITSQCAHLHSEMKALCSQPHHVFTQYELSQIILKLLTLLSATVTIAYIVQPIDCITREEEEVKYQVKTKTDDGDRPSQSSTHDLDISNHANFDWGDMEPDTDEVQQVETKTDDGGRPSQSSIEDLASQSSIEGLDISNHANFDWGETEPEDNHVDAKSSTSPTPLKKVYSKSSSDLKALEYLQRIEHISSAFEDYLDEQLSKKEQQEDEQNSRNAFYRRNTITEKKQTVSLQFDNMGYIVGGAFSEDAINDSMLTMLSDGKQVLDKKELESISNSIKARTRRKKTRMKKQQQQDSWWFSSIFGSQEVKDDEWMLILNWQPLLRLLIKTTPFLNTQSQEPIRMQFLKNQTPLEKKTVLLITGSRKFFDQGIRPKGCNEMTTTDCTARELWHYVKMDLTDDTHPNSYFRALVILYLFHPSDCSRQFYLKHMPRWMERWQNIDQAAEIDFLWVVMFCRARRYVKESDFDWGRIKRHLEHVGPMLENSRWNDRARRMSGASSVMDIPIGLYDELRAMRPPDEPLDDVDEDWEKERENFVREYNNGSRANAPETLPDT
ncbi:hypothetical protein ACHAXN_012235, partial [Cyclotella atomus]